MIGPCQIVKTTIAHQAISGLNELGIHSKYVSFDGTSLLKSELALNSRVYVSAGMINRLDTRKLGYKLRIETKSTKPNQNNHSKNPKLDKAYAISRGKGRYGLWH